MITLTLENDRKIQIKKGSTLLEVLTQIGEHKEHTILGALVDNKMRELTATLDHDAKVRFVAIQSLDGIRVYQRSASFILIKALHDLQPEARIRILHPLANGLYCEISDFEGVSPDFIKALEEKMQELVKNDLPFTREEVPVEKAIEIFKNSGREDKARLLSFRNTNKASIYQLDDQVNYFYGYLAPRTSYIQRFSLAPYDKGFILQLPTLTHPTKLLPAKKSKKFYDIFKETLRWRKILEVQDVGMLNEIVKTNQYTEFVLISEAFHEKRIAQIADTIAKKKQVRVVLLSGPSASGKTTFTKRLAVQLKINGLKPLLISMDDYFMDRDKTPKDSHGEHDFESPFALNVELFQDHLKKIVAKEPYKLPKYDFKTGTSGTSDRTITPTDESIIIIEGIHGLNPMFSAGLPEENIFKIYVSALTEIPLDSHNRIPTTDARLLRRITRDHQFRNYSAADTLMRWPSVREGESKHVFPFQEEADVFFNTALIYELAALKTMAGPILEKVTPDSPAYSEALRLKKFLSYFLPIPIDVIPRHSILREFLGNSSFHY